MKQILFFACLTLGMKACETVDGDVVDTIKPSKTSLYFSAQGGVDTITSQETHRWLSEIIVINGKYYQFISEQDYEYRSIFSLLL
jgi:hypothetical protein